MCYLFSSYWLLPLSVIFGYVLVVSSTFLHEMAHKKAFSKYHITSKIYINWLGGKCKPVNKDENMKSEELSIQANREIIMAGTKSDLIFIIVLLLILFILSIKFYYLANSKFNYLHILLFLMVVIIGVLIIKLVNVYNNLFYQGKDEIKGDLSELIHQITKKINK